MAPKRRPDPGLNWASSPSWRSEDEGRGTAPVHSPSAPLQFQQLGSYLDDFHQGGSKRRLSAGDVNGAASAKPLSSSACCSLLSCQERKGHSETQKLGAERHEKATGFLRARGQVGRRKGRRRRAESVRRLAGGHALDCKSPSQRNKKKKAFAVGRPRLQKPLARKK